MYYLYTPHGQYAGTLYLPADQVASQTPDGFGVTLQEPRTSTDYWNGSEWIAISERPSAYHEYDYETKVWKDIRDINIVKDEKWKEIKRQRNSLEFGGFDYKGGRFDSEAISQTRILAAVIMGLPITWTLANDEPMELTEEDLQGLGMALANHVTTTHARGRVARQLIENAKTIEEVEGVVF